MGRLNDLGIKYNTDKCSNAHNFLETYERVLPKEVNTLIEIGVYEGASVQMWGEYYPNARIIGIDNNPMYMLNKNNIRSILQDTTDLETLKTCTDWSAADVIVEDGSHDWFDQLNIFFTVFPLLKSGAYYILEDLHSSNSEAYRNYRANPLLVFRNFNTFKMIDTYEWYDNPNTNQDLGSITLIMRKK